jgi:SAM-dependent methyltransferase
VDITMTDTTAFLPSSDWEATAPEVPAYLRETYAWAYLRPASLIIFDHSLVVSAILWGNANRLKRAAFAEIRPGQTVLQPACVYGRFSLDLATLVGPQGRLDVIDIAPIQAANCRRKLGKVRHAQVRVADAAAPGGGPYDVVCCFFLLHELPDDHKRRVVDGLLDSIAPGGKAVFVDYHLPLPFHPMKGPTSVVFDRLEPFAKTLWRREISNLASMPNQFSWRKEIYFGGLFQKVVAERSGRNPCLRTGGRGQVP